VLWEVGKVIQLSLLPDSIISAVIKQKKLQKKLAKIKELEELQEIEKL